MLQFADDTLFFGEASWGNAWARKCILQNFELASGLKINYAKSSLVGLNTNEGVLNSCADMLMCRTASTPFKYLGIPMGASPRRFNTWKPLIELMQKKLSVWKSRSLSFGGRITPLKSVRSNLPVYLLSFFKAPKTVIKACEKIQRTFLWGGDGDKRKVRWVSWDRVCTTKEGG